MRQLIRIVSRTAALVASTFFSGELEAANRQTQTAQLKVFLDCTTNCYEDFLRSEVIFVDYVRDRTEAEIHLLVTRAQTGSGGSRVHARLYRPWPLSGFDRDLEDRHHQLGH